MTFKGTTFPDGLKRCKWMSLVGLCVVGGMLGTLACPGSPITAGDGHESGFGNRVAGRFTDEESQAGVRPDAVKCTLHLREEGQASLTWPVALDEAGGFRIEDLPKDVSELVLEVELPEHYLRLPDVLLRQEETEASPTSEVSFGPILRPGTGIAIPVTPGGEIEGTLQVESGVSTRPWSVMAFWTPASRFECGTELVEVDAAGAFHLARIPVDRDIRVVVAGLRGSEFLSKQTVARAGDRGVRLPVGLGLCIKGWLSGSHAGLAGGSVCALPRSSEKWLDWRRDLAADLTTDGAFVINGLTGGEYDLLVSAADGGPRAFLESIPAGATDVVLATRPYEVMSGRVTGLLSGEEATVEVWWARNSVWLTSTHTAEDGRFSLSLPQGTDYTIFAHSGRRVAVKEHVRPTATDLLLSLAPGSSLRAALEGFRGPVYVVADRSGFRLSGWIGAGEGLCFEPVPEGSYRIQVLNYEQFYANFFMLPPGSTPLRVSRDYGGFIVSGRQDTVLHGPLVRNR